MNYKTFSDLSQDIKANLHKIPRDVSLVVGIPRSGLLVANLVSLYLNIPLTDLDSFINGHILSTGFRGKSGAKDAFKGRILVIDDSIYSGKALREAKLKLKSVIDAGKHNLSFCCVYVNPGCENLIDIPLVFLDMPRAFEWNIFHHTLLSKACVDIDGVLCEDPDQSENDDGELYLKFILNARPKFTPKVKIKALVTSRLEKYRASTEEWLHKQGIVFDELIMLDLPDRATRMKMNNHGEFKAAEYKRREDAIIFIESNRGQAQTIFEISGKDVYCVDTNEMYTRETYSKLAKRVKKKSGRLIRKLKRIVYKHVIAKFM